MAMEVSETSSQGLENGEVQVEVVRMDEAGGAVRARTLVDAPPGRVWDVIGNCQHARKYLAGMEGCEVLVDEPHRAETHHVVDPGWFAPTLDYRFETAREPFTRMEFHLLEGNLRAMDGYWLLTPHGEGTLVEHELRIRPETPSPRWLVRRKLARDLPRMMRCIRALSRGSLAESAVVDDMESCQEPKADDNQ